MAISVDKVYKKVLSILNKEARGFLTPDEFAKLGSQVQLDLLDKAFYEYNKAIVKRTMGRSGQGYADISTKIQDKIDPFFATTSVTLTSGVGTLPTFYNIINISANNRLTEIERVEKSKLSFLLSSPLTAPSTTFPMYYITGATINVNPTDFISFIQMDYIIVPEDPFWSHTVDANGALTFVEISSQNFALHPSSEVELVIGILKYAGVIIKDPSIIQAISQEQMLKKQIEN
tara:strand:+ start:2297 stop:2992 length:696 start_codon:yes stop_codon:yes gene_type:complete